MRLIPILLLAGCASAPAPQWVRPGATATEYEMDKGQCQAQALSVAYPPTPQTVVIFNSCMRGKGWRQAQ